MSAADDVRVAEAGGYVCPETRDGQHCGDWHEVGKCGACGQAGPDPDEDQADEPEPPRRTTPVRRSTTRAGRASTATT